MTREQVHVMFHQGEAPLGHIWQGLGATVGGEQSAQYFVSSILYQESILLLGKKVNIIIMFQQCKCMYFKFSHLPLLICSSFGYMFDMKFKIIANLINIWMDVPVRDMKKGKDIWLKE